MLRLHLTTINIVINHLQTYMKNYGKRIGVDKDILDVINLLFLAAEKLQAIIERKKTNDATEV